MTERIDIHVHAYEAPVARRALDNVLAFRAHAGIVGVEISEDGTPDHLLRGMERLGIGLSVLQAVVPRPEMMGKVNAWTAAAVRDSAGRLLAFGGIHPLARKAAIADTLKRFKEEYDFRGVKLHPTLQCFDPLGTEARRLYDWIGNAGLPLLIHPDRRADPPFHIPGAEGGRPQDALESHPDHVLTNEKLCQLIEACAGLTIVASHLGGSHSDRLEAAVKASPDVWLDLAIVKVFFPEGPEHVASLVRRYGVENVLFGSDFPYWPQEAALEYAERMGLSDEERQRIERENPRRILGL
jgi:predicted TIM-barrel fold metal-dependent hydrolase